MYTHENKKFIVFENISKNYQDVLALNNVSFEIDEGEIFGYIGPNGAGKTTTIKIMTGLITDFTGKYSINNYLMPQDTAKVQKLFGYLPQDVAFQEWRTVDHALQTFGKLSGIGKNERGQKIIELLGLLDITKVRHKKISKLSGGMIQKVGLVQALLHTPQFLVLDEPLAGLDPESRFKVKKIIKNLSMNGTTVFFSSHILSDVQDIATRIGIINKGHIIKIGTLDDLKSDFQITNDIEIILSQDSDKWKELCSLRGIKSIELSKPLTLLVHTDKNADMDEISYLLIRKLVELGCHIHSFKPVTPDLDEVYRNYIEGDKSP